MILSNILKDVGELPTLPTIYSQLLEAMSNTRSTAKDIANIIEKDQAATIKLLKSVNSPIFSIAKSIDNIQNAIFFLGFNEVKNLVFSLSMIDMFNNSKQVPYFNLVEYWKHSIAVGVATRIIGKICGEKNIENYFVAGIIHDIGKLILIYYGKTDYSKVIEYAIERNIGIGYAEMAVLGTDHLEIGAIVAEKWGIPETLINPIRHHLKGMVFDKFDKLTACVHLADVIARALNLGIAGDNFIPRPNPDIWKHLNISIDLFSSINNEIYCIYNEAISVLITSKD